MKKEIMIAGLGRMGSGIAERLINSRIKPYLFNRDYSVTQSIARLGGIALKNFEDFADVLCDVKIIWLMLPSGSVTNEYVEKSMKVLKKGDILIDGSNSNWKVSVENYKKLKSYGIYYLDAGVSGGIWGREKGYCIMVGGDKYAFDICDEYFNSLSSDKSYLYCGKSGSGHFIKMVHNAVEYALMQSYAEGFEMIKSFDGLSVSKKDIAMLWNKNSVIRSWLLEMIILSLEKDDNLSDIKSYIEDSGEGRWALEYALEKSIPVDLIASSLFKRFRSRMKEPFYEKLIAAMREKFGGHKVYRDEK